MNVESVVNPSLAHVWNSEFACDNKSETRIVKRRREAGENGPVIFPRALRLNVTGNSIRFDFARVGAD